MLKAPRREVLGKVKNKGLSASIRANSCAPRLNNRLLSASLTARMPREAEEAPMLRPLELLVRALARGKRVAATLPRVKTKNS